MTISPFRKLKLVLRKSASSAGEAVTLFTAHRTSSIQSGATLHFLCYFQSNDTGSPLLAKMIELDRHTSGSPNRNLAFSVATCAEVLLPSERTIPAGSRNDKPAKRSQRSNDRTYKTGIFKALDRLSITGIDCPCRFANLLGVLARPSKR